MYVVFLAGRFLFDFIGMDSDGVSFFFPSCLSICCLPDIVDNPHWGFSERGYVQSLIC
jgi:hypothetical protein